MTEQIKFELGGRYRNRLGWYKVLGFRKNELIVRYEKDGRKDNLDIELQIRITKNMNWEESRVSTNQS